MLSQFLFSNCQLIAGLTQVDVVVEKKGAIMDFVQDLIMMMWSYIEVSYIKMTRIKFYKFNISLI